MTIPDSVTSLGDNVFYGCSGLTSVTIPDSVTSIGIYAFKGCTGLTSVTIPNSVTSIGIYAFYGCTGLTSVTIPNSVTLIGNSVFYGCTGLTSITIPNSVTSIGSGAFSGCEGITSLTFEEGESVLNIASDAFYNVMPSEVYFGRQMDFMAVSRTALKTVEFGKNVTSIGSYAYNSASLLRTITAHSAVPPTISEATFAQETYYLGVLYVPKSAINAYKAATGWKKFVNIQAVENITGIAEVDNDSNDSQVRVDGQAICVDEDSDVCIVAMNGTTIYNGRGNISINVAPGIYVVVVNNIATKVAVK